MAHLDAPAPLPLAPFRTARRAGIAEGLVQLWALRRSRRQLLDLDAHRLDDAGVTSDEAIAEARRPVWDPPPWWWRL